MLWICSNAFFMSMITSLIFLFCPSVCFFSRDSCTKSWQNSCQLRCIFCIVCTFFPIAFFIYSKKWFSSTYRNPTDNFLFVEQICSTGASIQKFRHWTNGHALKVSKTPQPNLRSPFPIHTFHTNLCRLMYLLLHPILSNNNQKPSPYDIQKWGLAKELQVWSSSPIYFGTLKVFQEILG